MELVVGMGREPYTYEFLSNVNVTLTIASGTPRDRVSDRLNAGAFHKSI
jgi:hypothetical protein